LPHLAVLSGRWNGNDDVLIVAAEPDWVGVDIPDLPRRTEGDPATSPSVTVKEHLSGLTYGLVHYEGGIAYNWTSKFSSSMPNSFARLSPCRVMRESAPSGFCAFTRNLAVFSADGRLLHLAGPSVHFRQAIESILVTEAAAQGEPPPTDRWSCGPFIGDWNAARYREAFAKVQAYILAGDCYQINLAQRFRAPFQGSPLAAFASLQAGIRAPYAAYLATPSCRIASLSPEHFITIDGHELRSDPIKGTRRRGSDPASDSALRQALLDSEKDRAENLMIVDLLRNDLGKVAVCGSVQVSDLFRVETFDNVHHLVSTIRATLRSGIAPLEALLGALPGGSVTGAPKRRAVEIIAELEAAPREAYCGTVFASNGHRLVSNLTIRTLQFQGDTVTLWGGGGIVADSHWASEYNESIVKINHIVRALGAPELPFLRNAPQS